MVGPIIDSQDMFKSGDMAENPYTKEEEKQIVVSLLYKVMEQVLYPTYYPNLQPAERYRAADLAEQIAEVLAQNNLMLIAPRKYTSVERNKEFFNTELVLYILGKREDKKLSVVEAIPANMDAEYFEKAMQSRKAQLGLALVDLLFPVEEDKDDTRDA